MTGADRIAAIQARHDDWYNSDPHGAEWDDLPGEFGDMAGASMYDLAMAHQMVRNDVPHLLAALRAVLDVPESPMHDAIDDADAAYKDGLNVMRDRFHALIDQHLGSM